MKTLLFILLCFVGLDAMAQAPAILRNRYTTNADGIAVAVLSASGGNVPLKANNGSDFASPQSVRTNIIVGDSFDLPLTAQENSYWSAVHRQAYEDATQFTENWANLTAWDNSTASMVVSNGVCYYNGAGSNPFALAHSFTLTSNDTARILVRFIVPTTATTASGPLVWFGLSTDTAGSVGPGGAGNTLGMGINYGNGANTNYLTWIWNPSSLTGDTCYTGQLKGGNNTGYYSTNYAGTYTLEISVDTNIISFVLQDAAHTNEFRARFNRTGQFLTNINNIFFWNNDPRKEGGIGISTVGARKSTATISPRAGVEGTNDFVVNTKDDAGQNIRVTIPKSYDSRVPARCILYFHGTDGFQENADYDRGAPTRAFAQALIDDGCIVAWSANHGDADYGSTNSASDGINLLNWVQRHYAISSVYVISESAGGPTALNFVASHQANVAAFVGINTVCSLNSMWTNLTYTAGSNFIQSVYGIAADGHDFASKTLGRDPSLVPPDRFYGVPMRFYVTLGDTAVYPTPNAFVMTNRLSAFAREMSVYVGTGNHGDPSTFQSADVLSFFQRQNNLKMGAVTSGGGGGTFIGNNSGMGTNTTFYGQTAFNGNITNANGTMAANLPVVTGAGTNFTTRLLTPADVTPQYVARFSSGTYTFTGSLALLFPGSPATLTLSASGTWLIFAGVNVRYNAATCAAGNSIYLTLRRTSGTPSDIGQYSQMTVRTMTTTTDEAGYFHIAPCIYTGTAGDVIKIYGFIGTPAPTAGSIDADQSYLTAFQIN